MNSGKEVKTMPTRKTITSTAGLKQKASAVIKKAVKKVMEAIARGAVGSPRKL